MPRSVRKFDRTAEVFSAAMLGGWLVLSTGAAGQTPIDIANASFEAPETFFAFPDAAIWEETGPVGENPLLPGVVDSLDTGVFFNSPVDETGNPSLFFIQNADGSQLGFIGADDSMDIAFLQKLPIPFESQATYTLQVLVGESFFFPPLTFNPNDPDPPPEPDPALLALQLFYTDEGVNDFEVAERIVSAAELPAGDDQAIRLADFSAMTDSPVTGAAAVGASIGVAIRPMLGLSGVWNVDLVRLSVECPTGKPTRTWDLDLSGRTELQDARLLIGCLGGPEEATVPVGCAPCASSRLRDANEDDDIDLADWADFSASFDGSP